MEQEEFIVEGYRFSTVSDAKLAENERKGVDYLKKKTKSAKPLGMLTIYNRVLSEELFQTPVGLSYLKDLQRQLLESSEIDNNLVKEIPVNPIQNIKKNNHIVDRIKFTFSETRSAYKARLKLSVIANIVLVIVIIAMFIIVNTSNNVNIINYETELINRYEKWSQELDEREAAIEIKEQELKEQGQ